MGKELSNTKQIMKRHSGLQKPVQILTPLAHGIAPSLHLTASWCNVGPGPQTCSIHWERLFMGCFVFGCISTCLSSWRVLLVCFLESRSVGEPYILSRVATGLAKVRLKRLLSLAAAFAMKFSINNGGCAYKLAQSLI